MNASHLNQIVNASKVALFMISEGPGGTMGNADTILHWHSLGKVYHPHPGLVVVVYY